MLLAAIDDPDPVMVFEHKLLYKMKGEVPEEAYRIPIGKAHVARKGRDVTVVATSIMVHKSLEAAETLAAEGIDVEVIDLRTLRPIDTATIIESVKKTTRLACVYEGVKTLGIGAEISALHRRERGLRLSRCADPAAGRRRIAHSLQSAAREGRRAAGARHHRRRCAIS